MTRGGFALPEAFWLGEDPRVWSTDTAERVERAILSRLMASTNPARVLDIGTGTGRMISTLRGISGDVVALDVDRRFLRHSVHSSPKSGRVRYLQADSTALPLKSGSFSAAVLIRVIHRSSDPERMLKEVHRVLGKDGHLIISYSPHPSLKTLEFDLRG
jgi:ubiquinone/menaquinone biosynthesis C-methylase UbiE